MAVFEEIGLTWKGHEYIVAPDQVMGLIAEIEEHVTIEEMVGGKGIKRAKISAAYAAALRYASRMSGTPLRIDETEVYQALFGADFASSTTKIITALLTLMIPPEHLQVKPEAAKKKASSAPARKRKDAAG